MTARRTASRRQVLAALAAGGVATVAGCNGSSDADSTRTDGTLAPTHDATTQAPTNGRTVTSRRAGQDRLFRYKGGVDELLLQSDHEHNAAVAILTSEDDRDRLDGSEPADEWLLGGTEYTIADLWSFLDTTDYDESYVLAVQWQVHNVDNTLELERLDRSTADTVRLWMAERTDGTLTARATKVLFVRVTLDGGTEPPTTADVTLSDGDETFRFSNEDG